MNIIVSSWPAAGGTTTALVLANSLNYPYLYAGSVLRFLSNLLFPSSTGDRMSEFEQFHGKEWDHIWEKYREWVMAKPNKILLEGKTAGFLQQDRSNIYSIMLTAELNIRSKRIVKEGRKETVEQMHVREIKDGKRWEDQFGFDLYSYDDIRKHYTLHVDTTHLTIYDQIETIYNALANHPIFAEDYFFPTLVKNLPNQLRMIDDGGKQAIMRELEAKELLYTPEKVLKDWITYFSEDVEKLSPNFRELVHNIAAKV